MTNKSKGRYERLIFHRDGTVTYWSVYNQTWVRSRKINDEELAAMNPEQRQMLMRRQGMLPTKRKGGSRCACLPSSTKGQAARRAPSKRRDWIIRDFTNVYWPGVLAYRGPRTPKGKGYPTEAAARMRLADVGRHYNGKYGRSPGELSVIERNW